MHAPGMLILSISVGGKVIITIAIDNSYNEWMHSYQLDTVGHWKVTVTALSLARGQGDL